MSADTEAVPQRIEVRLPSLGDARLQVASVLLSVQALGQISLGFELSIAQILVSLLTAGAIEVLVTFRRSRVLAWPASALLTGNGVALIMRVPGTEHGDWWSLNGWYVFAATAALSVLSKYVIRAGGRPLFNPSNLGLVLAFLILGSGIADPQDLWWGPMSAGLVLTYLVINAGGLLITSRLGLLSVAAGFWVPFAALMGLLAASGHQMTARWSIGAVSGFDYWSTLALSPEILIFTFFMITDPRTAARGRAAQVVYGVGVASASAVLVAFQTTEYATKVAVLAGLVLICAARPLIERLAPSTAGEPGTWSWATSTPRRSGALCAAVLAVLALVALGSATSELPAVTVAALGATPSVELTEAQRPVVELGAGTDDYGDSMDAETAEQVAIDTVEAVLVLDRAAAEGDADLAATVATGPALDSMADAAAVPAPERTFELATVDVVKEDEDFQALPMIVVELHGTEDGRPWSGSWVVAPTAGRYLLLRPLPAP